MKIFSEQEIARRHGRIRDSMAAKGLDALLATSYANAYYVSGAPIHPFGRPMAAVLPLASEPAMVTSIIEAKHVEAQSWIRDLSFYWDYNPTPTFEAPRPPVASMVYLLTEWLRRHGLNRSRLGIEELTLPLNHFELIREALPEAELVPSSLLLDRVRQVLSDEELTLLTAADEVADIGQEELIDALRRRRRGQEIVARCRSLMEAVVLQRWPEYPFAFRFATGLGDGAKSAGHSEWITWNRESKPVEGQVLTTGVDVLFWGYQGNVERTVVVGQPSDRVSRDFSVMVEANEAAIAAVRPGVPLAEVDRLCKDVFARHGHGTRTGSGLGRGITSYEANARNLTMELRLYADAVFEPGMAFSIEPDLQTEDGTYRHCNTIVVTPDGCKVNSQIERGLICV